MVYTRKSETQNLPKADSLSGLIPMARAPRTDRSSGQILQKQNLGLMLAIEQSSDTGSAAIINAGKILGEREWNSVNSRSCGLFKYLKELIASAGINLKDIDRYIVDVGPGSYGGLRASMAAVKAFAMPDKKPVYALTAPETIAFEIMQETSVDTVQVVVMRAVGSYGHVRINQTEIFQFFALNFAWSPKMIYALHRVRL